jgi:hypothetical protein
MDPALTLPAVRSIVVVADAYPAGDAPGVPADPSVGVVARYARGSRLSPGAAPKARGVAPLDRGASRRRGEACRRGLSGPRGTGGEGVRRHGAAAGARAGAPGRARMVRAQHHAHPPAAGILLLPGRASSRGAAAGRPAVRGGSVRFVPRLPRCVPHRGAPRARCGRRPRHGRPPVHLLPDDRVAGPDPRELRSAIGNRIFGCDICQEVCPWNERFRAPDPEGRYAARGPGERPVGVEALPGEAPVTAVTETARCHPGTRAPSLVELLETALDDEMGLVLTRLTDPQARASGLRPQRLRRARQLGLAGSGARTDGRVVRPGAARAWARGLGAGRDRDASGARRAGRAPGRRAGDVGRRRGPDGAGRATSFGSVTAVTEKHDS